MAEFNKKFKSEVVAVAQQQVMRLGEDGIIESVPCSAKTMEALKGDTERINRYISAIISSKTSDEGYKPLTKTEQQSRYLSKINCYHCLDEGIHLIPMRKPQGVYTFGVVCDCQTRADKPKFTASIDTDIVTLARQGLYKIDCKLASTCVFTQKTGRCNFHKCSKFDA